MNDFYIIAPSNACMDIFPQSRANNYTITWENPIELDEQWCVALTEANFNFTNASVNSDFGIAYTYLWRLEFRREVELQLDGELNIRVLSWFKDPNEPFDLFNETSFSVNHLGKVIINASHKFEIEFEDANVAKMLGFTEKITSSGGDDQTLFTITSPLPMKAPKKLKSVRGIYLKYFSEQLNGTNEKRFSGEQHWSSVDDMIGAMRVYFSDIFKSLQCDDDGKKVVSFALKDNVVDLKFLNGFNFVLGFDKVCIKKHTNADIFTALYPAQLERGLSNIYVYASVCRPIRVGDAKVPLLKSIWLDNYKREYKFGEVRNFHIKNPMYIPLSTSSINSIEINVRSDSGRFVPFFDGAVTSLTLHFKRNGSNRGGV